MSPKLKESKEVHGLELFPKNRPPNEDHPSPEPKREALDEKLRRYKLYFFKIRLGGA